MKASTSTRISYYKEIKSRDGIFSEALRLLEPDHRAHMAALCGTSGVGKTVLMQKVKEVVEGKNMFDWIVEVYMGAKPEITSIQDVVADWLGLNLTEGSIAARAYKLRKSFEARSNGGVNKILLILDGICQFIDLNDIGLNPLPNQGVDFKVLLTSQDRDVCIRMGVEVNSILKVELLGRSEIENLYFKFLIADDNEYRTCLLIANECYGFPLAIRVMARALIGKSYENLENTLHTLMKLRDEGGAMHQHIKVAYESLQLEESRSTLLMCGLFPQGFDIPTEELVRYCWGLKLFENVDTIRETRKMMNKCLNQLINSCLLIRSQSLGCVKMHNLVRSFVLDLSSKSKHASFVGNMSKLLVKGMSERCKRISLTCSDRPEFPGDCKYPNLLLLKLVHGDKSLKFPENFCKEMKKLEVVACDIMECPLPLKSLQCSTNLRTLCLRRCLSTFDCSLIGHLLNLEVLSLAHCNIQKLPSTIGNLKKLKLLDLTGCINLLIDDGVFNNLVKLEELYMGVAEQEAIEFSDKNYDELAECSKNLFALEIEFFDHSTLLKNIALQNLERFKISLGCFLREASCQNRHLYQNTLMLCIGKRELLDSGIHELFEKTLVLNLQVHGINDIGEVTVDSLNPQQTTFHNLRILEVCECADLRYLFPVQVANGLINLEHLTISLCPILETLVDSGNSGVGAIKFQALKFLSLGQLPKLMSLCNSVDVIELPRLEELILHNLPNFTCIYPGIKPSTSSTWNNTRAMQSFLNKEVVVPKLKILKIFYMTELKEIWPSQVSNRQAVSFPTLTRIIVEGCDNLVNLFPWNPMLLLHHLEGLKVWNCGSLEVLFNIDLGCAGQIEQGNNLRHIEAVGLVKLKDIWRVKVANNRPNILIPSVEYIKIRRCESFRNVIHYDMRALTKVTIDGIVGLGESESLNQMVESSEAEVETETKAEAEAEAEGVTETKKKNKKAWWSSWKRRV